MIRHAVASRKFQFCAGPERHRFYACPDHEVFLADEAPSDVFFVIRAEPIEPEEPCNEIQCDYCRGEDGP